MNGVKTYFWRSTKSSGRFVIAFPASKSFLRPEIWLIEFGKTERPFSDKLSSTRLDNSPKFSENYHKIQEIKNFFLKINSGPEFLVSNRPNKGYFLILTIKSADCTWKFGDLVSRKI